MQPATSEKVLSISDYIQNTTDYIPNVTNVSNIRSHIPETQTYRSRLFSRKALIRYLVTLLIIFTICFVILLYYLLKQDDICYTKSCVKEANQILQNIDASINPCDDFYQFACGGYLKTQHISPRRSKVNSFVLLMNTETEGVKEELMNRNDGDSREVKLEKQFYKKCTDEDLTNNFDEQYVRKLLYKLGWPPGNRNWKEETFSWIELVTDIARNGLKQTVIDLSVQRDPVNSKTALIFIGIPQIGLHLSHLEPHNLNLFKSAFKKACTLLSNNNINSEVDIEDTLNFIIKIEKLSSLEQFEKKLLTVSDLNKVYNSVQWLKLFQNMYSSYTEININTKIYVDKQYLEQIVKLINGTSKRILANSFLVWLINMSMLFLTPEIRSVTLTTKNALSRNRKIDIENYCLEWCEKELSLIHGAMYVNKWLDKDKMKYTEQVFETLRKTFIERLKKKQWMDKATRTEAANKAKAMKRILGYYKIMAEPIFLHKYYKNLSLTTSIIESVCAIYKHNYEHKMINILKNGFVDFLTYSDLPPYLVNAFHELETNMIFVSMVMINFLSIPDAPAYLNFGGLGLMMGHELTHAFDNKGRLYDSDGNIHNWWHPETLIKFKSLVSCFVDQYNEYEVFPGKRINGIITVGENIADNGGTLISYEAMKYWEKKENMLQLPGLNNYTPRQLFWIKAANNFCSKETDEQMISGLQAEHSLGKFRVIGSFSNSREFARDFKCKDGDNMVRKTRCAIW